MTIELSNKAEKELDKIPDTQALRISESILKLKETPFPTGYQKLGDGVGYRIRVGDYRVI